MQLYELHTVLHYLQEQKEDFLDLDASGEKIVSRTNEGRSIWAQQGILWCRQKGKVRLQREPQKNSNIWVTNRRVGILACDKQ